MCQTASEQSWLSPFFVNKNEAVKPCPRRPLNAALFRRACRKSKTKRILSFPGAESAAGFVRRKRIRMNGWELRLRCCSAAAFSYVWALRSRGQPQDSAASERRQPIRGQRSPPSLCHLSLIPPLFWSFQFHFSIQALPFCHPLTVFFFFFSIGISPVHPSSFVSPVHLALFRFWEYQVKSCPSTSFWNGK